MYIFTCNAWSSRSQAVSHRLPLGLPRGRRLGLLRGAPREGAGHMLLSGGLATGFKTPSLPAGPSPPSPAGLNYTIVLLCYTIQYNTIISPP